MEQISEEINRKFQMWKLMTFLREAENVLHCGCNMNNLL